MLLKLICQYLHEKFCIHVNQGYWSLVLFCWVSVWFRNQSNAGFIEGVWKFSFPFYFLEQFEKDRYYFCFKCLVEFPREAIWCWTLIFWEIFDNWFNFFTGYGSIRIFYFFLFEFWKCAGCLTQCWKFQHQQSDNKRKSKPSKLAKKIGRAHV